jgi:hypothetical protein
MEYYFLKRKLPQKDTLIGSIFIFILLYFLLTTRFNQIWYITNLTIEEKKLKSFYMMVIYWILYYK